MNAVDSLSSSLTVFIHAARVVYAGAVLFENLDLTLDGGRWTSLLGPSGVGKTTLLRLIAGLADSAESESVRCQDGRPVAGRVAYMAQQDLLLPWRSALDNVLMGAALRGEDLRDAEPRARDLLDRVGLAERTDARPAQLSGGQRQRVALARTLFEDRPIVLMDEPFSALDAVTRFRLQNIAAELLAERTVLLVTHDPLEALRLSNSIYVMSGHPATLALFEPPAGPPPRAPDHPSVAEHHGRLLTRLAGPEHGAAT